MRVNPYASSGSVDPTRSASDAPRQATRGESAAPTGDVASLTRSPELSRLLEALAQQADVRPEVVAAVQAKIAAGELQTQAAAADAAAAIVDGGSGE